MEKKNRRVKGFKQLDSGVLISSPEQLGNLDDDKVHIYVISIIKALSLK